MLKRWNCEEKRKKTMEICIFLGYVIIGCSRVASYSPKLFPLSPSQTDKLYFQSSLAVWASANVMLAAVICITYKLFNEKKKKTVPNALTRFPTAITLKVTRSDRATSPRSLHSHLQKSYPTRNRIPIEEFT